MHAQTILLFPQLLRQLRTQKQLSQKALALTVQIDQSRLCALEKGRLTTADNGLISRLSQALDLDSGEHRQLQSAIEHDRLMEELARTSLARAGDAMSKLLQAAEYLSQDELLGLSAEIDAVSRSKRRLQTLTQRVIERSIQAPGGLP